MIKFLNGETQRRFHELPIDKQREWNEIGESHWRRGHVMTILYVEESAEGTLEVSIRVDEHSHAANPVEFD